MFGQLHSQHVLEFIATFTVHSETSFVEAIPNHINAKGGFDSMAEFVKYYMSGNLRLAASRDLTKGDEVYVRHATDAQDWHCFHDDKCTSRKLKYSYHTGESPLVLRFPITNIMFVLSPVL